MRKRRMTSAVSLAALFCTARLAQSTPVLTTLASFPSNSYPGDGLVADSSGNLYGTTESGGLSGDGTVFELSGVNHQTLTTLVNFNNSNGYEPLGTLVIDSAGNLYGTTEFGGANNSGTVFEVPAAHPTTVTTLFSFNSSSLSTTGAFPHTGLALDGSGNLYGTTKVDGFFNDGTAFELSGSSHSSFTLLASFNGSNGSAPYGSLIFDPAGNLYGTTYQGGTSGLGTIFRLSGAGHNILTTLASFNGSDGSAPSAALTFGTDGYLYGTAEQGGASGYGNVYRLSGTNFQTITSLYSFNGANGSYSFSPLVVDAAGNLFGSTQGLTSASPNGTLFELSGKNYQTMTSLATLSSANSSPSGPLLNDSSGILYGTTLGNTAGSAFQISGSGFVTVMPTINVSAGSTYTVSGLGSTVLAFNSVVLGAQSKLIFASSSEHPRRSIKIHDASISTGSTLNINNNDVDLDGTVTLQGMTSSSSIGAASSAVGMGNSGGTSNGSTGIISSTAADDATHLTAIGVIQNNQSGVALYSSLNPFDSEVPGPGDILIKYTYFGDANLDGVVDGSDYSLIDAGFLSHHALTGWYYGDYNYDGVVNGSDYALIDNSFNRQGAPQTEMVAQSTQSVASTTAVPEPAFPLIMAAPAVFILRRSRRKRFLAPRFGS